MSLEWSPEQLRELVRLQRERKSTQLAERIAKYRIAPQSSETRDDVHDTEVKLNEEPELVAIIDAYNAKFNATYLDTETALLKEREQYKTPREMRVFATVLSSSMTTLALAIDTLFDEMDNALQTKFFRGCPSTVTEDLAETGADGTPIRFYTSDNKPFYVPKLEIATYWYRYLASLGEPLDDDASKVEPPSREIVSYMARGARQAFGKAIEDLPKDHYLRRLYYNQLTLDSLDGHYQYESQVNIFDRNNTDFLLDKGLILQKSLQKREVSVGKAAEV